MADDHAPPTRTRDAVDDALDAILAKIPPIGGAQYQAELEEDIASAEQSEADYAAGRFISSEAMKRWVGSLHTEHPPPRRQCGE